MLVYHEVEAKAFERVDTFIGVHLAPGGTEAVRCQLLDLREDVALEIYIKAAVVLINVVLEFVVAQFVSRFKFTVVFGLLLDGIVRQVHHPI